MEVSSPAILALFVLMGGLIAYVGDWLGRKLGKKRLRLAGLRPRHTAVVFTVISGMLIPVATTYAILTISAPVREWMAKGPQIVREYKELEGRNAMLNQQAEEAQSQVTDLRTEVGRNEARVREQQAQLAKLEGEVSDAVASKNQAEAAHRRAESERAAAQAQVTQLKTEADGLSREVSRLRQEQEAANRFSLQLAHEVEVAENNLEQAQQELTQLQQDKERLQREVDTLEMTESSLRNRVAALTDESARLQAGIGRLLQGIESIRTSTLLFRKDEELSRLVMQGGKTPNEILQQLSTLVKSANVRALERGVEPDEHGIAAGIVERQRITSEGTITISVEAQVRSIIEAIASTTDDLVLIARSYYNYFQEEDLPVPLEIGVFRNRVVFEQDAVVASTVIDGSRTLDEIISTLASFINRDVREAALTAGMIPVAGGENTLGSVNVRQVIDVAEAIHAQGGNVRVDAKAQARTRSADILLLSLVIRNDR
ncbi:MAG: Chromosome partition protein Smc [Fimbriimonadales bacterium]|nr:DUF3084 domain-containing protein [Armatimonadota bacterium]MBV6502980.1 Chromosome partition protein Smc [Fimbriimonadales bacterium]NOG92526.1 DUF3084 domain-containing protein [Armatimonadota bacterium]